MRRGALALLSLLSATAASAAESPAGTPAPGASAGDSVELDPVTVEARRRRQLIDERVSEFVRTIVGSAKAESVARWKVPVCAIAAGLTVSQADFVRHRIKMIASDAGVPLGMGDCAPNLIVIVTPEPAAFLKDWWAEEHRLFNRDRGLGGVDRMIRTDQPVRVWHNACNVPPGLGFELSGQPNCGTGATGSRLTWNAVRAIYSAIVVVDLDDIEGLTFGQVADYVAMVGLAQLRKDAELGDASTILGLFAAGDADRPKGLTDWDQAFLKAVYSTLDGSVTEISQIKLRMGNELAR
jgi:hypothetical protein